MRRGEASGRDEKHQKAPVLGIQREDEAQAPEDARTGSSKRRGNFFEVNLGFTAEQAMAEAKRCLLCQKYPCSSGCPVNVKIPEFLGSGRQRGVHEGADHHQGG